MAEAFGLDRKIENYKGARPITLYRWDLDCLMDVIDVALKDERDYPDKSTPEYQALQKVCERIHQEYDAVYGHEKIARPGKVAVTTAEWIGRLEGPAMQPALARSCCVGG